MTRDAQPLEDVFNGLLRAARADDADPTSECLLALIDTLTNNEAREQLALMAGFAVGFLNTLAELSGTPVPDLIENIAGRIDAVTKNP